MPKARRRRGQSENLLALATTPERRAQGPIERLLTPIEDTFGNWVQPLIGLDTLLRMERAGSIKPQERMAGARFHHDFRLAHLDRLFASDTTRLPVILANGTNWREVEGGE